MSLSRRIVPWPCASLVFRFRAPHGAFGISCGLAARCPHRAAPQSAVRSLASHPHRRAPLRTTLSYPVVRSRCPAPSRAHLVVPRGPVPWYVAFRAGWRRDGDIAPYRYYPRKIYPCPAPRAPRHIIAARPVVPPRCVRTARVPWCVWHCVGLAARCLAAGPSGSDRKSVV